MRNRSRSTLFLMEQLVVITVFAICAAVCVSVLVDSYHISGDSHDKSNALRVLESAAECYKSTSGDTEAAASILRCGSDGGGSNVYYDADWQSCPESAGVFVLTFTSQQPSGVPEALSNCEVSVSRADGTEIAAFNVAARKGTK